jgi:hypothetical protein
VLNLKKGQEILIRGEFESGGRNLELRDCEFGEPTPPGPRMSTP